MEEKMTQLDTDVFGHDLKTVQALQRRHDNLERELAPVEEKVNKVMLLGNSVQNAYPNEKKNVVRKQNEINDLWQKVMGKAAQQRNRLEDAVGQQIFTNSCKDLLRWVADVKDQLNADNVVKDVATAENLLKQHQDLKEDLDAKNDEFNQLTNLGRKLLKSNPDNKDVAENIERLTAEQAALARGWKEKQKWLEQCLQLQLLNKEADNIDAATSAHQAFLEFSDLGNSLDEVEALQKRHLAFANTLIAQDDRVNAFSKKADALIADQHYDSAGIDDKRNQVLAKRQAVKAVCQQRTNVLDASKNYQEFCAEVEDLRKWMAEKLKTASDESYRDLSNLERKKQKHEAFERELRANEGQLRTVNKLGQALIAQDSYRKDDVARTLHDLNDDWQKLVGISLEKGRRLRQAEIQQDYNNDVDDVKNKLDEIEENLRSTNVGNDLRSCRDLLKKHDILQTELTQCADRVDSLVSQSNDLNDAGHFDSDTIKQNALASQQRLKQLDEPARRRRAALEEALKFYEFGFELDAELQWIKEHMPLASSQELGQNLHQAQNLHKKHKKLQAEIVGHEPVIEKTLQTGLGLINQQHPESKKIDELCEKLKEAWTELEDQANERAQKLELSLKAQQFFFEANEVESWLNERADILASRDYGRDRDSATKLLTKHKALELELDTYNNIIAEMGHGAQALIKSGHPDSKLIQERQSSLEHLVRSLQRKAAIRQQRLMESFFRHEYFVESEELERWIAENLQQASSEDYGQDYEHLLLLKERFNDFKHRIDSGAGRFKQCEDLAQKLIVNDSPYSADIQQKQQQLEKAWENLHDQIGQREQRLNAAGEIHRFHKDVEDAIQRIHEKTAALGVDLGRDLNSAVALLRKHETFENELVVLEAQLQLLLEDASKLIMIYPSNKKNLQAKQEVVVEAWSGLKERTELRRDQLQASVDLQKFLTQVRDLTNWATNLRLSMEAENNVKSAARAQVLKNEHEALKGEIEAREKNFQDVRDNLDAMEQTGHYAADEANARYNNLIQERDKLHKAWQIKKIELDQLCDLHMFLREAKVIEDASNAQEATLTNLDFGDTVDVVTNQLKKHEEFEKLINHQDKNLEALKLSGSKLLNQNHFESHQIANKIKEIDAKRRNVHKLSERRKQLLLDALLYTEFNRDVAEVQNWIEEKQKNLDAIKIGDVSDLEDKIKKLQKHQAFQAEVAANLGKIEEVKENGEILLKKQHKESKDIEEKLIKLDTAWKQLLREVDLRGKGLEEAQDILEFNNQLDQIKSWIREKEVMIQAGDTGKDYEHCQQLQRKLDDVDSDMKIDDTKIKTINALANKLTKQNRPGVQERRDDIVKKWHSLQGALADYREKLSAASEIHLFDSDVADTCERISEKQLVLETDDVGKDLSTVEALQRKQEALESEMMAVENKINQNHQKDGILLSEKYPHKANHLENKLETVRDKWFKLLEARERRKNMLVNAYNRQKFLSDVEKLEQWVNETIKRMEVHQKPNSVSEAEVLVEAHKELKAEINGRNKEFDKLIDDGTNKSGLDDPEIKKNVDKLADLKNSIHSAWKRHDEELLHEYDLQDFKEQANQLNNWLSSKEAFLNNDDLGDTPRAVETLLRKHQDFESMLKQQLVRVDELEAVANKIMSDTNRNNKLVSSKLNAIISRKNNLLDKAERRKLLLEQSKALQEFLRNVYDVQTWLNQKLQIASDENYREPSNLQNKIQKHATFEAEVTASHERIQNVVEEGKDLITANHYASNEISIRLDELENDWKHLQELSNLKRDRLEEAHQALLFNRSIDEFESWLNEVEAQIISTDTGRDFATANNLLKRHIALENDIQQHNEICDQIHEQSEHFTNNNHFMSDEIEEKAQNAITRYHQLKQPLEARRDLLESATMLQQFNRDIDDEIAWLRDREPIATSGELGNSLTAVQSLQKKHQALEAELASREPIVQSLMSRAAHLTRSGHPSASVINQKANDLKNQLAQLRDAASIRRLRLQDALEAQSFYEEANEVETWIHDKRPLLATREVGKDEDSVQSLQKKLEALSIEVQAYKTTVTKLSNTANSLIEREHYDSSNIAAKKVQLEKQFDELIKLVVQREVLLAEANEYFSFLQECNDVHEWIKDQITKTDSEEYGNDLEHVELLIQAFDTHHNTIQNSEPKVESIENKGMAIIEAKGHHSGEVQQKVNELKTAWHDLLELVYARKEALAGAKQVHVFDRTIEEIKFWIQEKEAGLAYDFYSQDSEAIQNQIRKHQALESEMKAIKDKVDFIGEERDQLIADYPDTKEHIDDKYEDMIEAWENLQDQAEKKKNNLQQSEELQTYFDEYQELLAWINEMLAKITAPELPQDCTEAELLIERHKEYKVEIDGKLNLFSLFYDKGQNFIRRGHFLAHDIEDKIKILQQRIELLKNTWQKRAIIYDQNLDVQLFKREAHTLENWMAIRESTLRDRKVGESILHVEELIKKHRDFEETIKAQEEKFEALKRITLVEESFQQQLKQEALARKAEKERLEQERQQQRKQQEMQRITEQRRKEQHHNQPQQPPEERVNGTHHLHPQIIEPEPTGTNVSLRKTNSVAHMFDRDRMRRGSDHSVKRAESMKVGLTSKPPKRTPSFTTRRRGSFRERNTDKLPPVEAEQFLDRKQLLIAGGKKASNRAWKNSLTVLCGQLLCFFKNKDDFAASKASCPPINIHNAICTVADDYQKRKHTFRLIITDGSEFLFSCNSQADMMDWINKISGRAKLPPSQQLWHFEVPKDNNEFEISSQSSRTSSPDVADQVILRNDPHPQNGGYSANSTPHRYTTGESPPPLPMTEPPNNYASQRHYSLDTGSIYDGNNLQPKTSPVQRGSTLQSANDVPKMSSRIKDLFSRKKRSTSQM